MKPSPRRSEQNNRPQSNTSWGKVATWYDDMLEKNEDTYQAKVILPNVMRVLALDPKETVVELGCGQGFFAREFAKTGARVIGLDIGRDLIEIAKKRSIEEKIPTSRLSYGVASADAAKVVADKTADAVVLILALQNMKNLHAVMQEVKRIMVPGGRAVLVMSHPAFRIPKQSHWGYDEASSTQFRRVDQYLSESEIVIDMNPGKTARDGKVSNQSTTRTFHRSLQDYVKAFSKSGLAISRLEEWISHRYSENGPRRIAEDRARKEIPLFMCLELRLLS